MLSEYPVPAPAVQDERRISLPSLTGLRFIAAVLVFMFHITLLSSPLPPVGIVRVNPFADNELAKNLQTLFGKTGFVGVSFFFVLSGFVLTWSASTREPARSFWRRRVLKIFPNHIVTWAFLMIFFVGGTAAPTAWLSNLLLVHAYVPAPAIFSSVNQVSWTLCSEMLFYLFFPLIFRMIMRIDPRRLWLWAVAMVAGMATVDLIADFVVPDSPANGFLISVNKFWFGYFFPPGRLFEFVLGALLARIVISGRWLPIGMGKASLLAVAGYATALYVPFLYGLTLPMIVPISCLICAAATADLKGTRSLMRKPTMQWLGEVSFGFYLSQGIVIFYGRQYVSHNRLYGVPGAVGMVIAYLAATLLAGWLLYVCVERPVMRRWGRSRTSRTAVARAEQLEPADSSEAV